ncbi:MAG TPA: CAP domain-containing protein [Candidatus Dormibacteraeota bacterium]
MVDALRGLAAFIVAGLATTASLGHLHLPATQHVTAKTIQVQAAAPTLDIIAGEFVSGIPAKPAPAVEIPVLTDNPPPADDSGAAPAAGPGYAPPAGRGTGPAPAPAITIGSAQQAMINADRASAGLPPLQWSSCLAGVAYSNAVRMANAGAISHAGGVQSDFGCGLGSSQTGENVGYWSGGVNDGQLNSMFMNSPEHRANIMGPYRYVGTAWKVAANGAGYIAVEFG